ncbi:MAG: hypothetical protein U1D30_17505 [Planctomycetota bacterium]
MRDNVDVMERIARLRERLTAPQPAHAAGAAEGALGKRLSQVKYQLESHNFDSSGLAMALLDPMEMAEPFESTPTARNPEADPILESPEFRNLRERIEEFIQEFADWGSVDSATRSQVPHQASTFEGIDADTILWADRQRQAYSLAEFTRDALRACEGSVNRQLRVLPALHSIHNQLTLIRDQLAFQSSRRGRDRAVLNSIRDTHQRAMDGNLPSRTELDSLVHSLLEMRLTESIPPLTSLFTGPSRSTARWLFVLNTRRLSTTHLA